MSSDTRFHSRWSKACKNKKCEECTSMSCKHHCHGQFSKDSM